MSTSLLGFRGRVPPLPGLLARLAALPPGTEVQLLRADRILGADHLRAAVLRAERAFARSANVAATWPLEVLRYAAAERQLGRALGFLGLVEGGEEIAAAVRGDPAPVLALAAQLGWSRDDAVLAPSEAGFAAWGFSAEELRALPAPRRPELVWERVALTDIAR